MSIRQLIPSLGAELDELCARLSCVEELLGVGVLSRENSNADESCRICGITWQLGAGPDESPHAKRPKNGFWGWPSPNIKLSFSN